MSIGIGSKSRLAYAEETEFGVFPVDAPAYQLGFNSESIQNTRNTFMSDEINPNRSVSAIRSGNVAAGGDITLELAATGLGVLFKHLLMGGITTTAVTPTALPVSTAVARGSYFTSGGRVYLCTRSGTTSVSNVLSSTDSNVQTLNGTAMFQYFGTGTVYRHVFNSGIARPAGGLSFERTVVSSGDETFFTYVGGRVNTFGLNIPQEGIVTSTLGMLFLDMDTAQNNEAQFVSYNATAEEPFAGSGASIEVQLQAGSSFEDLSISTASLNVTNNYDTNIYTIGRTRRRDIVEQRREVTGSFTAFFEDLTKFNYFKNESELLVRYILCHKGMHMRITLPYVKFTGGSPTPTIGGNGVVSSSFDYQAFAPVAGTSDITVELYNANDGSLYASPAL